MKPVSGSAIALLTANEVMTQVAWFALAPRLPEIAGNDTLAMVVSSTCMNDARASPIVASARLGGRKPGMFAAVVGESAIAGGSAFAGEVGLHDLADQRIGFRQLLRV